MAEFNEKFFGKLSGKFGDFIGVIKGDDNYVTKRSSSRKIDNSPEAVERRAKFKASIQAAKAVTSLTNLKHIWGEKSPKKLSAYNYCIKYNYANIDSDGPRTGYSIVPGQGFSFSIESYSRTDDGIDLTILPLTNSSTFDTDKESHIEASFVILMKNPDSTTSKFSFTALRSNRLPLIIDGNHTFSVIFEDTFKEYLSQFAEVKIYIALNTSDANETPIQFSSQLVR